VVVLRYVRHTDYNAYLYVTSYSNLYDYVDGEPHAAGEVVNRTGPATFTGYYGSNYYDFYLDSATRVGTFDVGTGASMYGTQSGAPCTGCVGTSSKVIQYGDYITPVVKVLSVNSSGNYIIVSRTPTFYYRAGDWVCNLKATTAALITSITAQGVNWKLQFDEIDGTFNATDYLWISKSVPVGTSAMTPAQLTTALNQHQAKAVRLYGSTVKQSAVYYDQDTRIISNGFTDTPLRLSTRIRLPRRSPSNTRAATRSSRSTSSTSWPRTWTRGIWRRRYLRPPWWPNGTISGRRSLPIPSPPWPETTTKPSP